MAPTLRTVVSSLPPEGAAAPAARQSRFRGPGWPGSVSVCIYFVKQTLESNT